MAYTDYSATTPASTQTGTQFADSALANDRALRDAILMGNMKGFAFSKSAGVEPQYWYWTSGTTILRATLTWGTTAGSDGQITQAVWALSTNGGSDYTTSPGGAIVTQTFTYDSDGNLETTGTSTAAGLSSVLMSQIGRLRQHTEKTGTNVHGLGTISTQSAASVAITGGTIAGTAITTSTASLTYEREAKVAKGSISSSTAIDWAAGGLQTVTVTGAGATLTHSNLPNGVVGYVTLDVTNGGLASSLLTGCKFAGGSAPSLTSSGRDVISLMCHDGSTVSVVGVVKDVR